MSANHKPGYSVFWEKRGRTCFGVATMLGYGPGAALAIPLHRLGLKPNTISWLSLGVLLLGLILAGWVFEDRLIGGLILGFSLYLSYVMDCVDGLIARVSESGSSFGIILDKVIDHASALLIPGLLGLAAIDDVNRVVSRNWLPFVLVFCMLPRPVLALAVHLKDSLRFGMDHLQSSAPRYSMGDMAKKIIGNIQDEPIYRIGVSVAWMSGFFWDFMIGFHFSCYFILAGYLYSSKCTLEQWDAEQRK